MILLHGAIALCGQLWRGLGWLHQFGVYLLILFAYFCFGALAAGVVLWLVSLPLLLLGYPLPDMAWQLVQWTAGLLLVVGMVYRNWRT